MSTQAEGGTPGINAGGPDNCFDGAGAHPEVDATTPQDIGANIRIRQSWQTGEGAPESSGFALGTDRPD